MPIVCEHRGAHAGSQRRDPEIVRRHRLARAPLRDDDGQRMVIDVVATLLGLLLFGLDLTATRRIWRSAQLERTQKVAQTVLVWLVPGAFVAVRYALDPPTEPQEDPTVSRPRREWDTVPPDVNRAP